MWDVATTDAFDERFIGLTDPEREEAAAKVSLLKLFGPALSRPHADTLKGSAHTNMKELRGSTGRSVLRVAFAFDPDRKAMLLTGGDKAGVGERRFYKTLIAKADALFDAHFLELKDRKRGK